MTNTSSKLDTVGHTQRPPGAPRHASEKRRHADPAPVPVPHEPHQKAAVNVDDQQPIVDDAAAAKSRHREQKALRREAKKARRAARSNMAAAAAVLVAAPQTAMTASASQAADLLILDAGNPQPNSSRDNCQAVTALPCSVAAPAEGVVKMAEVCKDPVDAAGIAPVPGCIPSYRLTMQTSACMVASGKCAVMLCNYQLCQWCICAKCGRLCTNTMLQCEAVCPCGCTKQHLFPIMQFALFVKFESKTYS